MHPEKVSGARIGALIIDSIIVTAINAVFYVAFLAVGLSVAVVYLISLIVSFVYFVVLVAQRGATPGKELLGLRVVTDDGSLPDIGKAFLRHLLWIADSFPYCLPLVGLFVALKDPQGKRVGDKVAGTLVVRADSVGAGPGAFGGSAAGAAGAGFGGGGLPQHQPQQQQPFPQAQQQPPQASQPQPVQPQAAQPEPAQPAAESPQLRKPDSAPAPEAAPPPKLGTQAMPAISVKKPEPSPDPKPASGPPADWYPDPNGVKRLRYWDGTTWTEHVAD